MQKKEALTKPVTTSADIIVLTRGAMVPHSIMMGNGITKPAVAVDGWKYVGAGDLYGINAGLAGEGSYLEGPTG